MMPSDMMVSLVALVSVLLKVTMPRVNMTNKHVACSALYGKCIFTTRISGDTALADELIAASKTPTFAANALRLQSIFNSTLLGPETAYWNATSTGAAHAKVGDTLHFKVILYIAPTSGAIQGKSDPNLYANYVPVYGALPTSGKQACSCTFACRDRCQISTPASLDWPKGA